MNKTNLKRLAVLLGVLTPVLFFARAGEAQAIYGDIAFSQLWERTDRIVQVAPGSRSWYWGPQAGAIKTEQYKQAPSGKRLVQYFDKARMEINNPNADRNSEWYITTGLLVVEMTSGQMQVGDNDFVWHGSADIPVAGDANDPNAPTYTSFADVASINNNNRRADNRSGQPLTATINRAGQTGDNPEWASDPGAVAVAYSDVFGHNIPRAIWEFMNSGGPVLESGSINYVRPVTNWIYTMGYPITEPYWTRVLAGGQPLDVQIQLFERRALVYIPSYDAPWNVQMANVGAQYYQWLYNEPLPPAQNTPTNTPIPTATNTPVPTNTPLPTNTPQPTSTARPATNTAVPTATVSGQPGDPRNVDGTVSPPSGPAGTVFSFSISKFNPVESVASFFTDPNGRTFDSGLSRVTSQSGEISNINIDSTGFADGAWSITFVGSASRHQSKVYFQVGAAPKTTPVPATATRPPNAPTNTPAPTAAPGATATVNVSPAEGAKTTQFTFSGSGLSAGEAVDFWFVDPTNRYWYPSAGRQLTATSAGAVSLQITPNDAFYDVPNGVWTFYIEGRTSRKTGNVRFVLK